MATLSKGYTFGATESVTNTKLHDLVDLGAITDIVDADISGSADIDSTKLDLSSAGYLTAGGNFTVTGNYAFSALASLSQMRLQTGVITSLMSVAEIRSPNMYATSLESTNNFFTHINTTSLASISELWAAKINIGSLASIGSPMPYRGIVSSLASGALGQFDGNSNFVGANIADISPGIEYSVGDVLLQSADTVRTELGTTFVVKKDITVAFGGTLRIKFTLYKDIATGGRYAEGYIYRNGGQVGTLRQNDTTTQTEYSEDIAGWTAGDSCQIYIRMSTTTGGQTATLKNFRIYAAHDYLNTVVTD